MKRTISCLFTALLLTAGGAVGAPPVFSTDFALLPGGAVSATELNSVSTGGIWFLNLHRGAGHEIQDSSGDKALLLDDPDGSGNEGTMQFASVILDAPLYLPAGEVTWQFRAATRRTGSDKGLRFAFCDATGTKVAATIDWYNDGSVTLNANEHGGSADFSYLYPWNAASTAVRDVSVTFSGGAVLATFGGASLVGTVQNGVTDIGKLKIYTVGSSVQARGLFLDDITVTATATAALGSGIALGVSDSLLQLGWASQAGHEYTVMASTNLVEGFSPRATLQATPPRNFWWEQIEAPRGFYRISRQLVTNTPVVLTDVAYNGGFDNGLDGWGSSVGGGADGTISVSGGTAFVNIVDGGSEQFNIFLRNLGNTFESGREYTVRFMARAAVPRSIHVRLIDGAGATYKEQNFSIGTNMATYELSLDMTSPTVTDGKIHFGLGGNDNSVWLDNVELLEVDRSGTRAAAYEMNRRMGRGNNFMVWLAMEGKGAPEDYELLNRHHFQHCRIGYGMDLVCGDAPDYLIPSAEMARLQSLVDWCLAQGLVAVVDPVHHWTADDEDDYTHPDDRPKLRKLWEQVAAHFADYDLENVVFDIINEPRVDDNAAAIIQTGLAAIRGVPGNEERVVIVCGDGFSTRQALIDAFDNDEIPADDPYLIGTFHYYDPRPFTKQGGGEGYVPGTTWGTSSEYNQVNVDFDAVVAANEAWARRHNTAPLPLYLGEFGVDNEADRWHDHRKRWLHWVRMQAEARGMSWAHWRMYSNDRVEKGMGPWSYLGDQVIQRPDNRRFDVAPLEALIGRYEFEDGTAAGGVTFAADYAGFTGTGYAAFPETAGTNHAARVDGIYIARGLPHNPGQNVRICYASDADRHVRIITRNGSDVVQTLDNVLFPSTGGPDNWKTLDVALDFTSGEDVSLEVVATPDPGVNLDWLWITR